MTALSEADGDKFVYLIANTTSNELKIIQGGPDGNYLDSGTYESAVIDMGTSATFNRFYVSANLPASDKHPISDCHCRARQRQLHKRKLCFCRTGRDNKYEVRHGKRNSPGKRRKWVYKSRRMFKVSGLLIDDKLQHDTDVT